MVQSVSNFWTLIPAASLSLNGSPLLPHLQTQYCVDIKSGALSESMCTYVNDVCAKDELCLELGKTYIYKVKGKLLVLE